MDSRPPSCRPKPWHRALGAAALIALAPVTVQAQSGPEAIRAMYAEFRSAILDDDGESAVALVTDKSLDYYDHIKQLALEAPENELPSLPPFDQFHVAVFRHELARSELEGADAERIAAWFINEGWFGSGVFIFSELDSVDVTGDFATAKVVHQGAQLSIEYQFWREGGRWKIDLTAVHKMANRALLDLADRNRVSVAELISRLLQSISGRAVDPRVMQPMNAWDEG